MELCTYKIVGKLLRTHQKCKKSRIYAILDKKEEITYQPVYCACKSTRLRRHAHVKTVKVCAFDDGVCETDALNLSVLI